MAPRSVRVRMAPSPTGPFHVGSARTALYNWLFARHHQGRFVLRIEDTDPERSQDLWVQSALDSLRWLGLEWDEGPEVGGPCGPYFQSQRRSLYQEAVEELRRLGRVYDCYCTRAELDAMREEQRQRGVIAPRYDRRCRFLTAAQRREREALGHPPVVRIAMSDEGETAWEDLIRGPICVRNAEMHDVVLMRGDGWPTYNFAAVVDDHHMAITHVIRGEDHISNTPVQIHLTQALGWELPAFGHLPLLLGRDRSKLSKRHAATALLDYRDQGYLPEAMVNFLALLGWAPGEGETQEIFSLQELIERFSLSNINKAGAVFDLEKLEWMNGVYIRSLPVSELTERCQPWLQRAGLIRQPPSEEERAWLEQVVGLEQERIRRLDEVGHLLAFFFGDQVDIEPAAWEKWLTRPEVERLLSELAERLAALAPFDQAGIEQTVRSLAAEKGIRAASVIHPTRVAVTGRLTGPGLFETLAVLGQERCVLRLRRAVERIQQATHQP